jgi:ribonuclease BN (tRNA processing enzyme)
LIHEVLTHEWLAKRRDFQGYAAQFHTTTTQLTELATQAKPGLLILYHASRPCGLPLIPSGRRPRHY